MLGTTQPSAFVPPTSMWNPVGFLGGTQPLPTLPPPLIHPQHQPLQPPMFNLRRMLFPAPAQHSMLGGNAQALAQPRKLHYQGDGINRKSADGETSLIH
ncbi:unnamed protein product, partial [Mesorhabditis belari]|uniref:Uncharacterized protein n=1 Tax=Mesorhabditis belari TaxID=2138241 RepID=A0AAF3F8W4_9BILA